MTLDEAIKHCEEVAERQEYLSKQNHGYCDENRNIQKSKECADCAADHRQLAEWLRELKERRATVKCGKWIDVYEYCKINGYKPSGVAAYRWCSECMKGQEKTSDFCPNCGAKMSTEVKSN